jgi:predicted phosphodiesterase
MHGYASYSRMKIFELEKTYGAAPVTVIDPIRERMIIFSDLHRGSEGFRACEKNYLSALGHYYADGYTLAMLGDADDPGHEKISKDTDASPAAEARFLEAGRCIRIQGDSDPGQSVNGIRIALKNICGAETPEEIFLTHGHNSGEPDGPVLDPDARMAHDLAMHDWAASRNGRVALVAGHTHTPLFTRKLLYKTRLAYIAAAKSGDAKTAAFLKERSGYLDSLYALMEKKGLTQSERYFNPGCCSYLTGEVTGIEVAYGTIRLVCWQEERGMPRRTILDYMRIRSRELEATFTDELVQCANRRLH